MPRGPPVAVESRRLLDIEDSKSCSANEEAVSLSGKERFYFRESIGIIALMRREQNHTFLSWRNDTDTRSSYVRQE